MLYLFWLYSSPLYNNIIISESPLIDFFNAFFFLYISSGYAERTTDFCFFNGEIEILMKNWILLLFGKIPQTYRKMHFLACKAMDFAYLPQHLEKQMCGLRK